ncbi:hypothetical protein NRB16_12775 [Pseudomonas sp. LJDD11]|uniref:hypothetical protein n=1 Tax=Pseudomonas sp. LJDD11 TaxID=2931984 RepID=UPI00211B8A68|nr:hypothetical protein [Pseudomonas sp. LJDD11]MCQ9424389.1 hypothetical protein [Pseudomonas sp. LJDD11]
MKIIGRVPREEALKRIDHLIGAEYAGTLKGYISELTQIGRIVGPDESTSREMDPNRLHIQVDEAGSITGFHLG